MDSRLEEGLLKTIGLGVVAYYSFLILGDTPNRIASEFLASVPASLYVADFISEKVKGYLPKNSLLLTRLI